jgi:hypothetical protein
MEKIAQTVLFILLFILLVFHLLILIKIIPYKITWGGRLKSDKEMYRLEFFSIFLNLILLFIVFGDSGYINLHLQKSVYLLIRCLMTIFFLFSAIGNAISLNKIEQKYFAPLAAIMTLFSFILALSK